MRTKRVRMGGPADRNTYGLRRLLQRQAKFQRQHDGLRLSQFLDRLGLCQSDFGYLKQFTPARSSSHLHTPLIAVRILFHL